MKNLKLYNRTLGWLIFLTAAVVYFITIEPTTSLWDCGEFIPSVYKLEVNRPPGALLYMILAHVASLFTASYATVVKMINAMSALASAFTTMFIFWTTTHLVIKIFAVNNKIFLNNILTSLVHMHVNRLFSTKQRIYELVIYYFMHKFYKSQVGKMKYKPESIVNA